MAEFTTSEDRTPNSPVPVPACDEGAALGVQGTRDAELRALYDASPMGVAFLSPDLRYQRVNAALATMNGRSVAAHAGATLEEVLGEHAQQLRDALEQVMRTRAPLQFEFVASMPGSSEPRTFASTSTLARR